ncbi:MAG: lysophospholipid acyltransferase family protein [Elusimicrobiales bacterium]
MPFPKRLRHLIEYAFVRLAVAAFSLLSWERAAACGALLGRLAARLARRRFALSVANIRKALPDMSDRAEEIALKSWENIGVLAAELAQTSRMSGEQLFEKCVLENQQVVLELHKQGKSAIVHLGHIANWELPAMTVAAMGLPVCGVARHMRNPYVDRMLSEIRGRFGGEIIFHREPFFSCVRNIKRGKFLGVLMDQNCPGGEVFTSFFGAMAATSPLSALLSLKTQTPIIPLRVTRRDGKIIAILEEPIYPAPAYSREELLKLIAVLNGRLESWIRQEPHLWLWAHNRWKREGEAPQPGQTGAL